MVWEYNPEHGGNEWVRKGSKLLKTHKIQYQIQSDIRPTLSGAEEIDQNFTPDLLIKSFFEQDKTQIVHPINTRLENGTLRSQWLVVAPKKVNVAFKNTVVVNLKELHFDETLTHLPLGLEVCVKSMGCQKIASERLKAGTVLLKDIKFKSAVSLTYIFKWQLKDLWETKPSIHSQSVLVEN